MSPKNKPAEHESKPQHAGTEPLSDSTAQDALNAGSHGKGKGLLVWLARVLWPGKMRLETRAGLAILLSFIVLLGVFLVKRDRNSGGKPSTSTSQAVVLAVPATSEPNATSSSSAPGTASNSPSQTATSSITDSHQDGEGPVVPPAGLAQSNSVPKPLEPEAFVQTPPSPPGAGDLSSFAPPPVPSAVANEPPPESLTDTAALGPPLSGLPPADEAEPGPDKAISAPLSSGGTNALTLGGREELSDTTTLPQPVGNPSAGSGDQLDDTPPPSQGSPNQAVASLPTSAPSPSPLSPPSPGEDPLAPSPLPRDFGVSSATKSDSEVWIPIPNVANAKMLDRTPAPAASPSPARSADKARPLAEPQAAGLDLMQSVPHRVQRGENFATISKDYYGSMRFYKALWSANRDRVSAPDQLVVGQTILVPPPEALDRSLVDPPAAATGSRTVPKSADSRQPGLLTPIQHPRSSSEIELALPVARPLATKNTAPADSDDDDSASSAEPTYPKYVVGPHDTLRSIARDTLGDSHRFDEIFELNRDQLDDPLTRLRPGITLVLPDGARPGRRRR
jgi:nucleoid-associated protein YgaU